MDEQVFRRAADLAVAYLRGVDERPVREDASLAELRAALHAPLNEAPLPPTRVIEELAAAVDPGLIGIQSARYFGFVIGGGLEAAIAADWLTSAWDQNGAAIPSGRRRQWSRRSRASGCWTCSGCPRTQAPASRPAARWPTSRAWPRPATACSRKPAGTSSAMG